MFEPSASNCDLLFKANKSEEYLLLLTFAQLIKMIRDICVSCV